jgi:phospholipid/cholesterol/gamma-HCH transport system substrate-binding protein
MINDPSLYRNSDSVMLQLKTLLADIQRNPRRYINLRIF